MSLSLSETIQKLDTWSHNMLTSDGIDKLVMDCDIETFNEVLRIAKEHNLIYLRNVVAKLPDLRMRLHVVSALAASLAEDSAVAGVDAWKERGYTDD